MFFSVIKPNEPFLREAANDMTSSTYAEHQWVWNFFPSSPEQKRDFIYRRHLVDQMPCFYVVSTRQPKLLSEAWDVQSRAYEPRLQLGQRLSFHLRANPVVGRLGGPAIDKDGNPKIHSTGKRKDEAELKSVRHDVVMHAKKQLLLKQGFSGNAKWADWKDSNKPLIYDLVQKNCARWLEGVAQRNGFEIALTNEATPQQILQVDAYTQNKAGKRDRLINFSSVDFSGELLVTNPDLFQSALLNGIGHAKAFGCGLLLVRRPD